MTDWRQRAALSVGQVAEALGVARLHVQRAIEARELRTVTIAGQVRVPVRALLELLGEVEPQLDNEKAGTMQPTLAARRRADEILRDLGSRA